MRRIVWMGMLAMMAVMATVSAQAILNSPIPALPEEKPAGEKVPRECLGYHTTMAESCTFQCQEGDLIRIEGAAVNHRLPDACKCNPLYEPAELRIKASCGGVSVECSSDGCSTECQRISTETASSDDQNGTCMGQGGCGYFRCRSITAEEAAELEGSGEGWIIQIPGK